MILTPNDLVALALAGLPADFRSIVEAHFFDGESTYKIQRKRQMKRRDVESVINGALESIWISMLQGGVRGVGDVVDETGIVAGCNPITKLVGADDLVTGEGGGSITGSARAQSHN